MIVVFDRSGFHEKVYCQTRFDLHVQGCTLLRWCDNTKTDKWKNIWLEHVEVTDRSCHLISYTTISLNPQLCDGKVAQRFFLIFFYQVVFVLLQQTLPCNHTVCSGAVLGVSVMNGFCGLPHPLAHNIYC